ncbi:MAG: type II toxin-antitoxin system VapC family toxin [Victivallales bacterium]|jgi:PIN domain nuclease of toxin-antitoxin system
MNCLLDTHTLLWTVLDTGKLSAVAKSAILDTGNDIHVSAVSFWEISLKYSTGRLELKGILPDDFPKISADMGFSILELMPDTVATSYKLPKIQNNDPFDRLIAWQAIKSSLSLISCDKAFDDYTKYDLKRIW